MSVERDAMDRIESLKLPWYVTGSWALAAYTEPRMTRDLVDDLDWAYVERYAAALGIGDRLEAIRGG